MMDFFERLISSPKFRRTPIFLWAVIPAVIQTGIYPIIPFLLLTLALPYILYVMIQTYLCVTDSSTVSGIYSGMYLEGIGTSLQPSSDIETKSQLFKYLIGFKYFLIYFLIGSVLANAISLGFVVYVTGTSTLTSPLFATLVLVIIMCIMLRFRALFSWGADKKI